MKMDRARLIGRATLGASLIWLAAGAAPAPAGTCPPGGCVGDADGDGVVLINELIIAVNNSLNGCPTPAEELGTRVFTIAPVSASQRSALYSTALPVSVANAFTAGPVTIVGGTPDANGVAPLSLASDAMFAVRILDGSVVCFKLLAAGSSGTIDCDGGTPYDLTLTAEPGPDAPPATLLTGQGSDAGPGAATLQVMTQSAQLASGSDLALCATATYGEVTATAYTTATATVTKGSVGPLSLEGESFDCAAFTVTDGAGMLVSPSAANDPRAGGDVVNNLRIADHN
jgi:hypothetical protein